MAEAMVTGRMTPAKKEAGNRALKKLGLNASQAINQLYDFLIENGSMPFGETKESGHDKASIAEARSYVESLRLPTDNSFRGMTDDEIKRVRMSERYGIAIAGE